MEFGNAKRGQRFPRCREALKAQHRIAIIGTSNENTAHKGKACGAHPPRSRVELFQAGRHMGQEMLHGWRCQPSYLGAFIKTPEPHGIFRLRQRPKCRDFIG